MSRLDYKGSQPVNPTSPNVFTPSASSSCYVQFGRVVADDTALTLASGESQTLGPIDVPQTETDLIIKLWGSSYNSSGVSTQYLHFNGDQGASSYFWSFGTIEETAVGVFRPNRSYYHTFVGPTDFTDDVGSDDDWGVLVQLDSNGYSTSYVPGSSEVVVAEYTNTGFWKHVSGYGNTITVNAGGGTLYGSVHTLISGLYRSTDPITSVMASAASAGGVGSGFTPGSVLEVWGRC